MEHRNLHSVSIIGAGNVATHLALALMQSGIQIKEVWSNHVENADILASKVNATVCKDLKFIGMDIDLLIISVKDDAFHGIVQQLPSGIPAIIHTSGSLDMKLLTSLSQNLGVFYPLQSFNKNEALNWQIIPICVEANNDAFTEQLFNLGARLSQNVQYINSTQRIQLHIAAIFANNFSNYLFSLAYEVTTKQHLPFTLLIPLIQQTASRLGNTDPFLLQTGPAARKDLDVIKKHIELLLHHPEAKDVYQFLSKEIIKKADH